MSETDPPRLYLHYINEVVPHMRQALGVTNALAVPRVQKVVVNMGVGGATENKKRLEEALRHLGILAGQKPVVCKAKRSVSAFRLREGMNVGCKVTLRGMRMYEFLDRLISVVLPRIRDFRGLSAKAFDGRGNYTLGLAEQGVFPEIDPNDIEFVQGMDITVVITGGSDEASRELLLQLGMPLQRPETERAAG